MTALLTTSETAEQLSVSPRTVRRLIASGALPVVRIGRTVRVDRGVLAAFVRSRSSADSVGIEPANPRQKAAIHARSRGVDVAGDLRRRTTHDCVLAEASTEFGRKISSVSDLTWEEASFCLDRLELMQEHAAGMQESAVPA